MNLNTHTIKPGPLTDADFAPKGLDYQGRHQTKDTPWPLLEDRKPWHRPPLTWLDLACIFAAWCAGLVVIGLAGVGAWSLIQGVL
jgi:hypothetical protein